ncbi:MAG: tryptophan synthase subunit alpha [Armatimonadetes bacterium]|nr:tryptophan synthase subunit alpha [Armatimonadota bacterium]
MSRLARTFAALTDRPALIPFLMAGDPDHGTSRTFLQAAAESGDILEVGVPFSDPIADGPTIQRAAQRALAAGTTLAGVLDLVRDLRGSLERPIVLLTYLNPVLQHGVERFCRDAREAGVDGVVIPDLPADEADFLITPAREADLDTIFLVAPTTSDERIRLADERSRGFVYCVSLTGVTGVRAKAPPEAEDLVRRVKAFTDRPVCVGFGISTPEQAAAVSRLADGVIVGSAIVDLVERSGAGAPRAVAEFLRHVRTGLAASRRR